MNLVARFAVPTLGAIAIGALNAWLTLTPVDLSPVAIGTDTSPINIEKDVSNTNITRSILATKETYSRPLFDPHRREAPVRKLESEPAIAEALPTPTEPEQMPAEILPPDIELVGISLAASGGKALIKRGEETGAEWYGRGADVSGWRLAEISPSSVSIVHGDQKLTFDLYVNAQPK